MSSPIDLTNQPSSGPVPQPAPASDPTEAEINALAAQIMAMADNGPSATVAQATVVATALTATPPTCSINLSGSTVQIDGVRFLSNYTPVVNDTVSVLKQSGSVLIIGHTADTGTSSATTAGWTDTGITGIQYRKVMDSGAWKVQFIGSGTASSTSLFTLPTGFRPSGTRLLPVVLAGNALCWMQVTTGGVCTLVPQPGGGSSGSAGSHTHTVFDDHTHSHGGAVAVTSFADSGTDDPGGHTHTIPGGSLTFSNTLYLDSKEFFL